MSKRKIGVVTALAETFARKLSVPAAKLYVAGMAELSDEQAEQAAAIAVRRCKFMPAASELIEYARTSGVSYESQALIAFEQLNVALDQNKPSLMPPLVAAVVRQLGGFQLLYEMRLDEFSTWKRKDFLAAFTALSRENPERVAALASPQSEIGKALLGGLKLLLGREEVERTEQDNREKLMRLSQAAEVEDAQS